jgi:ABC-2 type transport system permease protein
LMIMSTAALTMRLLSEEKKQRTFDLLLTAPITAADIAIGKWIAGTAMAWALLAVSALYPISLVAFTSLEWGPLLSSYLCLMMLTGVYVALGLFASSLTESAVISVIMAIIFNFMLFFIGAPGQNAESPVTKAIFEQMNIGSHLNTFVNGNFSVAGATFFLSLIVLFVLLTQRVVESARWR